MKYFPKGDILTELLEKWKLPFLSTFIVGFLVHSFVFTNRFPNWDSINNFYSSQEKEMSGRFFLTFANGLSSYFELQWLNGVLTLLYLAVIVIMIIVLFNIKNSLVKILISILAVTAPTVASTFSYMYTADGYFLGVALAMVALVVAKHFEKGFLFSPFLIFISVGIYQANLA